MNRAYEAFRPTLFGATHFARVWRALGGSHAQAFETVERAYREPHRAHHGVEHIDECLAWLQGSAHLAERENELAVALYFHDAVYDPCASDNEQRSARLFEALARDAGIVRTTRARIAALISATQAHDEAVGDAALMSDIDLAVLGAWPRRYARFERQVRQEYAALPDDAFRRGRVRVLQNFLARLSIYQTPFFGGRLETQARLNLSCAVRALTM